MDERLRLVLMFVREVGDVDHKLWAEWNNPTVMHMVVEHGECFQGFG